MSPGPDGEAPRTARFTLGMAGGRALMRIGRGIATRLPASIRTRLDARFFYSVFQITRVTNDHYGWRPSDPGPQQRPAGWQHPWEAGPHGAEAPEAPEDTDDDTTDDDTRA